MAIERDVDCDAAVIVAAYLKRVVPSWANDEGSDVLALIGDLKVHAILLFLWAGLVRSPPAKPLLSLALGERRLVQVGFCESRYFVL